MAGYDIRGAADQVNELIGMIDLSKTTPELNAIIRKVQSDIAIIRQPVASGDTAVAEAQKKNYIKLIIYYGLLIYALYQFASYEEAAIDYVSTMPAFLYNLFFSIGKFAYDASMAAGVAGGDIVGSIVENMLLHPTIIEPLLAQLQGVFSCLTNLGATACGIMKNSMAALLSLYVLGSAVDFATGSDIAAVSLKPLITDTIGGVELTADRIRSTIMAGVVAGEGKAATLREDAMKRIGGVMNKVIEAIVAVPKYVHIIKDVVLTFAGDAINLTIAISDATLFGPITASLEILNRIDGLKLTVIRRSPRISAMLAAAPPPGAAAGSPARSGGGGAGGRAAAGSTAKSRSVAGKSTTTSTTLRGTLTDVARKTLQPLARVARKTLAGVASTARAAQLNPEYHEGGRRRRTRRGPKKHKRKTRRANKKQKTRKHKRKQTRRRRRRSSKK